MASFPALRIDWVNTHWQRLYTEAGDQLLFYSAFYDNRTRTDPVGGAVRVLTMYSGTDPLMDQEKLPWCHIWYDQQKPPVHSRILRAEYVDHQDPSPDRQQLFLLTCAAPPPTPADRADQIRDRVPIAVSIVNQPCQPATNLLKVMGKPDSEIPDYLLKQNDFSNLSSPLWRVAVCGPALFYVQEDFSIRLVEWLEMLRAIGVPQVFLYYLGAVHPNIEKVLKHYERDNFVTLTDFRYPPPYLDEPLLRRTWTQLERSSMFAMENVYFTDCILRNKDRYRFILRVDPDEIPLLMEHQSLSHLISNLSYTTREWVRPPQAFHFKWHNFPPVPQQHMTNSFSKIPSYYNVLRRPRRFVEDDLSRRHVVKSIFDTRDATGITSHTLIVCAAGECNMPYKVKLDLAYIGHFRTTCVDNCDQPTVEVPQLLAHQDQVMRHVDQVIQTLNLLS